MLIAFPFAFDEPSSIHNHLARIFVDTIKGKDKHVRLYQVSDETTPQIEGVDACIRHPRKTFGRWYFESMATIGGEFLRLDVDVFVRHIPYEVFEHTFDIAVAKENKGVMNNGVVFVRSRDFFLDCLHAYSSTSQNDWNDIQVATQAVIDSGKYRVRKLNASVYNFMPDNQSIPPTAKLVHYEGALRKRWM